MTGVPLSEAYGSLRWRGIGPYRGGRVSAVAGDPVDPLTFYFGCGGGGVWRTRSGGTLWENVSDGFFGTASVGALAVAPSDPNVVVAGTGEANIRGNVSYGDGVYRSTDGGRTWRRLGLADTRHIGRVRIHPRDEDVFYVAALGHAFGPNDERGVYRTCDGGRSFERVLFVDQDTGAIDLCMDPANPRVMYAAMWQVRRSPHNLCSGGPGSGLYRTADGGDSWERISDGEGFPKGVLGRIGVAASGGCPGRVYALVEAAEGGGMLRSDDGGRSWKLVSDKRALRSRPWYYMHVVADPVAPGTVYVLNNFMWRSTDGGASYVPIGTPHPDNHDLWIDPANPLRMVEGNDGGACVSFDGGTTWTSIYNQPTAELYHVTTSPGFPYRVYGAQQDNTTISLPSRSDDGAITEREWYTVGGAESGYIAVRPDDPNIVFAGSSGGGEGGRITRYDRRTGQRRDVSVWPERTRRMAAESYRFRFQWTSPLLLSPHDPGTLYSAGNHLFRSRDEGASWEQVSPDLTRNDQSRLGPSGGPITRDHTGVEVYCTIFALAESPVAPGMLWVGTDDGLVHVSRDGGQKWEEVTPPGLPEWSLVSIIEPSPFDPERAYLAATRYKLDDTTPYLFKTTDAGKSWQAIVAGIPAHDYVRVIREDPKAPGLLYCGTETGVYVSFDDGESWEPLRLNLPVVAVHDLVVHGDDLVAATHGRGFWILDGVAPLRQLRKDPQVGSLRLFEPATTTRVRSDAKLLLPKEEEFDRPVAVVELPAGTTHYLKAKPDPGEAAQVLDAGHNPPSGVVVHYVLDEEPDGPVTLAFQDANGQEIRSFSSEGKEGEEEDQPKVPARRGANRFVWDLRYPDAVKLKDMVGELSCAPGAPPGEYRVVLQVKDRSASARFSVRADPRVAVSDGELQEQFSFLVEVRDAVSRVHSAVNAIRQTRQDVEGMVERAKDGEEVQAAGRQLLERLGAVEAELTQVAVKAPQDEVAFPPGLNAQLAHVFAVAASADAAPTRQTRELFASLTASMEEHLARLDELAGETRAFAAKLAEHHVPLVSVPEVAGA